MTSNAGLRHGVPGERQLMQRPSGRRHGAHLVAAALLDHDLDARRARGIDRRGRAGDDERDPGRARPRARARRCRPCWRRRRWPRRGRSRRSPRRPRRRRSAPRRRRRRSAACGIPSRPQLVDGQPRALQQRPRLGGQHQLELAARRRARRSRPAPCRGPGAASAPVLQWVSTRRTPASKSAPWAASASLAATSSASIAPGLGERGRRRGSAPAATAAARTRSTA